MTKIAALKTCCVAIPAALIERFSRDGLISSRINVIVYIVLVLWFELVGSI
jgi:hypothetical protein